MILSGILHTSLGGFTVIRGVAPLGELARCSDFDPDYQRKLIDTHKDEIVRFLSDRNFLFFPEVILSASLQFDYNAYKGKDDSVHPIQNITTGKGFVSNVNGITIKTIKTRLPKLAEMVGAQKAPMLAYLTVPETEIEQGLRLFRIDGNHRLSAASGLTPSETTYGLATPFCVVLHEDNDQAERFEKVVFHNINAKQIPLTSEDNLRLILDEGEGRLFDDNTLLGSPSFGPAYYLARKLLTEIGSPFLQALSKPLENRRSLALALTQFLSERDEAIKEAKDVEALKAQVTRLREAFQKVNTVYQAHPKLMGNGCHGVLVAFLYFALHNDGRQLSAFTRWVSSNRIDHLTPQANTHSIGYHCQLGRIQAIEAASLVNVFESILTARSREIFISMAFGPETEETFKTIQKTVDQINTKHQLDVCLRPIRIDQCDDGHSYTIDAQILKVIEGAGLLIADLTFGNKNVYHELGYLMGLNSGKGLAQENFILIFDLNARGDKTKDDIGFNISAWKQLRFKSTRVLEKELTKSIELFYSLSDGC